MKTFSLLMSGFVALMSTGCGQELKSEYQTPRVAYPVNWQQNYDVDIATPFAWSAFHDKLLDQWLKQVMNSNNDLAVAVLRVYGARLEEERVGISTAPDVNATLNTGMQSDLDNASPWTNTSAGMLTTSYEVDLWGKLARQRNVAEWARQATEQDLRTARLALLTDASNNYWQIGLINQQITVFRQSIIYAKRTLLLANARYQAGSISSLDVINAEQSLLAQENSLLTLEHERQQALNARSLFLGSPPDHQVVEPTCLPTTPLPQINTGIPISVLSRRPDISSKELRLRETLANVDIKKNEYYPAFSLTGSLGTSSPSLLEFLRNPVGSVGVNLSLPFLEWRQISVDVKIARNDYEQQVLEFKQALYKAMVDVDDALSQRIQLMKQEIHLQAALELANKSERLNKVRYRQGATSISYWLDAQEQQRQATLALANNRFLQYQNLAKIYLEFGGSS